MDLESDGFHQMDLTQEGMFTFINFARHCPIQHRNIEHMLFQNYFLRIYASNLEYILKYEVKK